MLEECFVWLELVLVFLALYAYFGKQNRRNRTAKHLRMADVVKARLERQAADDIECDNTEDEIHDLEGSL